MIFDLEGARRREVQAIGAAISTRSWHGVETAYNALRDKMDAVLHQPTPPPVALSQTLPAPGEVDVEAIVRRSADRILKGFSWETLTGPENLEARLCMAARQAVHETTNALATVAAANDEGVADEVTLAQCPPGLFWAGKTLGFKSEYGNNEGRIDAFIISSGEFLWGPAPQTIARQRMMLVRPIDSDHAEAALATSGSQHEGAE